MPKNFVPKKYVNTGRPYKPSLAKKVARLSVAVSRVRPEKMRWTTYATGPTVAGTPLLYNVSSVAQGDANGQRVGLQIRPKNAKIMMRFTNTSNAPQVVRVIVFKWHDDYTNPPVLNTVLQNDTGGASAEYQAPLNIQNRDKFQVLKDFVLNLEETGNYTQMIMRKLSVNLKGKIIYKDDNALNYEKNNLYIMFYPSGAGSYTVNTDFSYTE